MKVPKHVLFDRELPIGWSITTVDAIKAEEKSACVAGPFGSNISSKYFVERGVPVIRGGNLTDDLIRFVPRNFVFVSPERAATYRAQHVRGDDLVFTCWGTIGQVGLIPKDGPFPEYIISNKQLKLRPNTALVDPLYLFYYFASPQMVVHIRNRAIGAAVPGINLGILKALPVVLPPLLVQRRISSILSAYDDLIENNSRRILILEEIARRIYEEWFVRFRFTGHEGVRMVESELGLVPEGWEVHRLGSLIELAYGKALKAEERRHGCVPVFGSSGVVGWHDTPHVAGPGIVIGRKGNVGSVHWSDAPFYPIDTTYYVVTKLPLHYVYFNLQHQNFLNNDAAVPGLNRKQAYSLPLVAPTPEVLDAFESQCESLLGLARVLSRQNVNLRTTRDLLLPKLISGELDVSELPEPEALAA